MRIPRLRWFLVTAAILAVVAAVILSRASGATPFVRDRVVEALNARFDSRVALESLQVSLFPRPEIAGSGLVLRHNGRTDVPPLLQIPSFSASAGLWGLRDQPLHLNTVELDGLDIRIPPGGLSPGSNGDRERYDGMTPPPPLRQVPAPPRQAALLIDLIRSTRSTLEIVPRDPAKLPRIFEIHDLEMRDFSDGAAATFRASLTNP